MVGLKLRERYCHARTGRIRREPASIANAGTPKCGRVPPTIVSLIPLGPLLWRPGWRFPLQRATPGETARTAPGRLLGALQVRVDTPEFRGPPETPLCQRESFHQQNTIRAKGTDHLGKKRALPNIVRTRSDRSVFRESGLLQIRVDQVKTAMQMYARLREYCPGAFHCTCWLRAGELPRGPARRWSNPLP